MIGNRLNSEVEIKVQKIRELLEKKSSNGLLINLRTDFSWLTAGGDNHVVNSTESGFSNLLITEKNKYLITDNIESNRILTEELNNQEWELVQFNWYEQDGLIKKVKQIVPKKLISDIPFPGASLVDIDFHHLRYSLLPTEIDRLRLLGKDVSSALESTCFELQPDMSEYQIAALLASNAIAKGIEPSARLVGVDQRTKKWRHPIPTDAKLKKHALVVLLGQRSGLYINCSRLVHFGSIDDELENNFEAMCKVDAAYILSTKVGTKYSNILRIGSEIYQTNGFKDEWKNFTQGGVIGYRSREFVVTPDTDEIVMKNQAVAWNPTISGVKGEDTILINEKGFEVVSLMQNWPMKEVEFKGEKVLRPDMLRR